MSSYFTFHSIEDLAKTGIYSIIQKSTGRRYIGSTAKSFHRRWYTHLYYLRKATHHSLFLQRAWDKYGADDFIFEIIEFYEVSTQNIYKGLLDLEQYYFDKFKPEFNILPSAHGNTRVKRSEETKKKISESNKGRKVDVEGKKRMSEAKKGNSVRAINTYILTSPLGEIITVKNLAKFCRENSISRTGLFQVISGSRKHSQGWKAIKVDCKYS